ncbi:hypothetical protein D3C81_1726570 [compost metagenome]
MRPRPEPSGITVQVHPKMFIDQLEQHDWQKQQDVGNCPLKHSLSGTDTDKHAENKQEQCKDTQRQAPFQGIRSRINVHIAAERLYDDCNNSRQPDWNHQQNQTAHSMGHQQMLPAQRQAVPQIRRHFGLQITEQEQTGSYRNRNGEQHLNLSADEKQILYSLRLGIRVNVHEHLQRQCE